MTSSVPNESGVRGYLKLLKQSLKGEEADYTSIPIRKAVLLLAIPMMLEMLMESVFALVDLYFVGHLPESSQAIQVVGLTESVLAVIYSIAIGMSMAATAVVARRIGEKKPDSASHSGIQAIIVASTITVLLGLSGVIFGTDILLLMGASKETAIAGTPFIRITMGSSLIIMLLFLINGIFRGAGNAAIAMKSLWIANICNIILCPIFINGFLFVPAYGLTGAAIATALGRGIGVAYQIYHLLNGKHQLRILARHFRLHFGIIKSIIKIATPGILQFVIASCSWIFLAQLVATTGGDDGSAGYQTALRLMMFFLLPAWGMSNAASTLVGQNLGAGELKRAEDSVMKTVKYKIIYMLVITLAFFFLGDWMVSFFTTDENVIIVAKRAMRIISTAFVFYGVGTVMIHAFNGAGDTWTPTYLNFAGFWLFQIPLAWVLSKYFAMGPDGVFIAIPVAETSIAVVAFILFRRGKWKKTKV